MSRGAALDAESCYLIWVARDRRYDGKVFAGVRTTGIYCRPVCPARTPLRKNMVFFRTVAAAEKAGFRACLRCRPSAKPGSPAWNGTASTVARGLALIESGWVAEHGIAALGRRLGLGERQIRRLFDRHLGRAPLKVLRNHQLETARKLLAETPWPVTRVANEAGFPSLRRFNDAFREKYCCTPTKMRRKKGSKP